MNIKIKELLPLVIVFLISCKEAGQKNKDHANSKNEMSTTMENYKKGTFGYDLDFLLSRDSSLIVLKSTYDSSHIVISSKYQGKVFTSTTDGMEGQSFGWVNYGAFDRPLDPHMNGYGGEDRLWLGPEGGRFSLFFKPGAKQEFEDWHTPAGFDSEAWKLIMHDSNEVMLEKDMNLENYQGTHFNIKIQRAIELLDKESIAKEFNIDINGVKTVAFQTLNTIFNTGSNTWDEKSGAPCTWNLDMFAPSPQCTIVIPYINDGNGKVATTSYFGEILADRIKYNNGILFFKADGKSRGKMGIPPARVKNIAGSYDAKNNVLTIAKFDIEPTGKYLNQEWRTDNDAYTGDAMNAYNDGPLKDGTQMGPFYEIESVSPAAFLKPGEKMTHKHNVYHFAGDKIVLSKIAQKLLGVPLMEIEKAF